MLAPLLALGLAMTASQQASPPADPKEAARAAARARQHQEDLENDRKMGAKYAAQAEKEYQLSEDPVAIERVQRIGREIAAIANATPVTVTWGDKRLNAFDYQFRVLKGKDVNAFSIPGGYIYVFEGLVKNAESDDELAGVMAHEVAHASLRHIATLQREQQRLMNASLPLVLLAILTGGASEALTLGGLVSQAKGSGWSVKAEEAADYAGFQYLRKSPYDTTGMLTFMERLAATERAAGGIDWGIYRSHPPSRERAESLAGFMRKASVPIRRSHVTTSFRVVARPVGDQMELFFGRRRLVGLAGPDASARATAAAKSLNAFFDTAPELFELGATSDGTVTGHGRPILRLTPNDAEAAGTDLATLGRDTLASMRTALFGLGFRVWDR